MKVKTMKIDDGKLRLIVKDQEFYLMDGVYRSTDGETITVRDHKIVDVFAVPNPKDATKEQFENFLSEAEQQIKRIGDDAQLANVDLQNILQKQQQTMQMLSQISKMLHDTAMSVIRKIDG